MNDPALASRVTAATADSRYTAEVNLAAPNDAHVLAVGRVPARSAVLDLGAADGSVAAVLRRMGCRVWAVEIDPGAAAVARAHCEEVVEEDLNTLDLAARFGGQRFDVVLMLDVLEHLVEPEEVLRRVAQILAPSGWAVVSVPNVAHLTLRLQLMAGQWTYTDVGLLDQTHLRFYDRAGVDGLLERGGFAAFDLARVTRRLGTTEVQVEAPDPDLVARLEADPDALTYQFVVTAAPLGSPVLADPPVLPAAVTQTTLLDALRQVERLQGELDAMSRCGPDTLLPQLMGILGAGAERRSQLYHLLAELDSLAAG